MAKQQIFPQFWFNVKSEMRRYERSTAESGPGARAGKVKRQKQVIAIGLSKARKDGKKAPAKNNDRRVSSHCSNSAP